MRSLLVVALVSASLGGCLPAPSPSIVAPDAAHPDMSQERPEDVLRTRPVEFDAVVFAVESARATGVRGDAETPTDEQTRWCGSPPSPALIPGAFIPAWALAWAISIAPGSSASPEVEVDGSGNTFLGNAIPWTGASTDGGSAPNDVLLSSVDADGNLRWAVRTTGAAPGLAALRPMEDGGAVVAFTCAGTVTPAAIQCGPNRSGALTIARFDATGALRWSHVLIDPSLPLRSPLVRDDDDNVYLVVGGELAGRRVHSLDRSGRVRWEQPAAPGEGEAWSVRVGELQSLRVDYVRAMGAIHWVRRGLDGTLLGQRELPFESIDPTFAGQPTGVAWAPDGEFYLSSFSLNGGDGITSSLSRVDACGRLRWATAFNEGFPWTTHAAGAPVADVSGAVCLVVNSTMRWAPLPPNTTCAQETTTTALYAFAPDGTPGLSIPFDGSLFGGLDRMVHCPSPPSLRAVSVITRRAVSALTTGRRLDVTAPVTALVRFVPPEDLRCAPGEHRCGGACTRTTTDTNHCGACGNACRFARGVGRCVEGACVLAGCHDGFADCDRDAVNGCEADLRVSSSHCGACGRSCGAATCVGGNCMTSDGPTPPWASDGHEGAFAPSGDVTLRAGVHHFTTVNVPEGVTVRGDGDTLELRATGEVVIRGVIDLSGGDGESPSQGASPPGGGGHTARRGHAAAATEGAGGAGGGFGEALGVPGNSREAGSAGRGLAGGRPGRSYHSSRCTVYSATLPPPSLGGRAWGAPYDGAAPVGGRSGCMDERVPGQQQAIWFTTGLSSEGGSIGRAAASDLGVFTTFGPGSGGGGGACELNSCDLRLAGGGGGGGGGALRVTSRVRVMVTDTGRLLANGGAGGRNAGAGSGGVIYLAAPEVRIEPGARVEAFAPGAVATPVSGLGRIRLSVDPVRCALRGTFNPPLAAGCSLSPEGGRDGVVFIAPWPR